MIKKRNLSKELNVKSCIEAASTVLDISVDKIKCIVNKRISSLSKEIKQTK